MDSKLQSFIKIEPGVFSDQSGSILLNQNLIVELLVESTKTRNKRSRILLHPKKEDFLHEMVIALPENSFDRPHINFKSGKSFVALYGHFAVVLFSETGEIFPKFLSHNRDFGNIMIRINDPTWHTIVPIGGPCVFLETILGPFEGNRFAPFSPDVNEEETFFEFSEKVRQAVSKSMSQLYPNLDPLINGCDGKDYFFE